MIKSLKIIYIFLFIIISGCGYQTIYGTKDINLRVEKIKLTGNNDLNKIINSYFNYYKNNKNYSKVIDVHINSSMKKEISSKDRKGNAKTFKLSVSIKLDILENEKIIKTNIFNKSSNYKSLDNKFDLNQYEENLINNLLNNIWQDIEITMHSLEFARIMNGEAELTLTSSS